MRQSLCDQTSRASLVTARSPLLCLSRNHLSSSLRVHILTEPITAKMSSLQISKSSFALIPTTHFSFRRKSNWVSPESSSRRKTLKLRRFKVFCGAHKDDNQSNGEEPPESLFMKELKRRGITRTSLLEETDRGSYGLDGERKVKEDGSIFNRNAISTEIEIEKGLANQRERSMALNSEGLEGLIPRAKVLLTIGGTFFLGFGPLILVTVAFFFAVYWYFGESFVHDASNLSTAPPEYIEPYMLLEEERISQMDLRVN